MHTPAFHRWMSRLALAAALLLTLAPTVGRVMARAAPGAVQAQLCTLGGLKWVTLTVPETGHAKSAPGTDQHAGHGGDDCSYCPLLASLSELAVPAISLAPQAFDAALTAVGITLRIKPEPPRGLGSRGPPRLT